MILWRPTGDVEIRPRSVILIILVPRVDVDTLQVLKYSVDGLPSRANNRPGVL